MELRSTLLSFALLPVLITNAQPTINWGDAPTNGDIVNYSDVDCTPTITSGPGQTWVLTGTTSPETQLVFLSPGSAPGYSNFPDATVAATDDDTHYTFLKADGTGLYIIGDYDNSDGTLTDYIDTWRYMAYPCTNGTTWTDGWSTSPVLGGAPDYMQPPLTFTADGYGTLVGNAGSMTNVLKVHQEEVNDTTMNGTHYLDVSTQDVFWKPGYPLYVANVFSYNSYMDGELQFGFSSVSMLDELAIGMAEDHAQAIGISLAPNPANDQVRVTFSAAGNASITVQDALGREVLAIGRTSLAPGIHQELLEVASLPAGPCVVRITTADGQTGSRKLLIVR